MLIKIIFQTKDAETTVPIDNAAKQARVQHLAARQGEPAGGDALDTAKKHFNGRKRVIETPQKA